MVGDYQPGRRTLLRGAAIVIGIGLAGCSDTSTADGGNGADDTTGEPEGIPDAVYAGVDDALVEIEAVQAAYAEEVEKLPDSLSYVAFKTGPMRGDLEAARANLDRAEEAAGSPPEGIGTLREITDYFERLIEGLAQYDDGLGRLETAELYAVNDRLEDGEAEAEIAVTAMEETVDLLEAAESERTGIDVDPLDGLIEFSPAQVRLSLEETAALGEELLSYAEGVGFYVRGTVDYVVGLDHYHAGDSLGMEGVWEDALSEYESARARFEAAHDESSAGEEVAPVPLLERFLALTCASGHYAEAAGHFADTIRAIMAGDREAEVEAYQAGIGAQRDAGEC